MIIDLVFQINQKVIRQLLHIYNYSSYIIDVNLDSEYFSEFLKVTNKVLACTAECFVSWPEGG